MWAVSIKKRKKIDTELKPGESLRWCAEPNPARHALKGIPHVLFSMLIAAPAAVWVYFSSGAIKIIGILFLVVGLGIMTIPFWKYKLARKTVYAITGKRAIIIEDFGGIKISSFGPEKLGQLEVKQRKDGSGDIIFKKEQWGKGQDKPPTTIKIGFEAIKNVKEVEAMLSKLHKNG